MTRLTVEIVVINTAGGGVILHLGTPQKLHFVGMGINEYCSVGQRNLVCYVLDLDTGLGTAVLKCTYPTYKQ